MTTLKNGDYWYTFCPYEVKEKLDIDLVNCWGSQFEENYLNCINYKDKLQNWKKIKAIDIFKIIATTLQERGLPYLFHKDTVNRTNPNSDSGMIYCGNLCQESYSNFDENLYHCCNLASVNLTFLDDTHKIAKVSKVAIDMLDAILSIATPPVKEARKHNNTLKTLGLGIIGLADFLAKNKVNYITGKELIKEVVSTIYLAAYKGSVWLNRHNDSGFYNVKVKAIEKDAIWKEYFEYHFPLTPGLKHSQIACIAPSTSTATLQRATASIHAPYKKVFLYKDKEDYSYIIPEFAKTHWHYYQEFVNMKVEDIIDYTALIQDYVDAGISMEYPLNTYAYGITMRTVYDWVMYAWEKDIKAMYYMRLLDKELTTCESCSG